MPDHSDASVPDYYARLGVSPSASADQIRAAYRRRARETHPDQNPDDPDAAERFQRIQEAYRVLRDADRRARYDDARARRKQRPAEIVVRSQAAAGCGGYVWRVLAGLVAVGLFFLLEAADVWAASPWTIALAVGAASIVAGILAVALARQFPDSATDVLVHFAADGVTMWVEGRKRLWVPWTEVQGVRLDEDGWRVELIVGPAAGRRLRRVPPVLVAVERSGRSARLRLDLSDTDVSRKDLFSFLHATDEIPFPSAASPSPSRTSSADQ